MQPGRSDGQYNYSCCTLSCSSQTSTRLVRIECQGTLPDTEPFGGLYPLEVFNLLGTLPFRPFCPLDHFAILWLSGEFGHLGTIPLKHLTFWGVLPFVTLSLWAIWPMRTLVFPATLPFMSLYLLLHFAIGGHFCLLWHFAFGGHFFLSQFSRRAILSFRALCPRDLWAICPLKALWGTLPFSELCLLSHSF